LDTITSGISSNRQLARVYVSGHICQPATAAESVHDTKFQIISVILLTN